MGAWSLYFFLKLGLYYKHQIGWHWWPNALFAFALVWPARTPVRRWFRNLAAIAVAMALFLWDANLPLSPGLLAQVSNLGSFRAQYLLELLHRLLPWSSMVIGMLLLIVYAIASYRIRFASLVFVAMIWVAAFPPMPANLEQSLLAHASAPGMTTPAISPSAFLDDGHGDEMDQRVVAAYNSQRNKMVSFDRAGVAQFDLIILSVCSLSNDDLTWSRSSSSFLQSFDIVFRHFNSGASYSGPAVLRLLRSNCGQVPQKDLYARPADDNCYLFHNLEAVGFEPAMLLNHSGQFDHFSDQMKDLGGVGSHLLNNQDGAVSMTAYDNSPIRNDGELLGRWWHQASQENSYHALVYNTISLHDGNHVPGLGADSLVTYSPRLTHLFADFSRLFELISISQRPTVVVLMPEHGAALRSTHLQMAGLRDIPTPMITEVPVAIKLFGFQGFTHAAAPLVVDRTSNYLDLTTLLGEILREGPLGTNRARLQAVLPLLPAVDWVAENDDTVVLLENQRSYLHGRSGQWVELPAADALPEAPRLSAGNGRD